MDSNALLRDQIKHKLNAVNLSSKHVKDAASFLLTQAEHSDFISNQWLEVFKNTNNPSFQLALLYVANEILTKSCKYGVSEFGEVLKPFVIEATQFLKPGPFITKLTKLINYWTYRKVFDVQFTEQLLQRINATEQVEQKNLTSPVWHNNADDMVKNFSPEKLLETLRKIKQLDDLCDLHGKSDISPIGYGVPIVNTVSSLKTKDESRTLTDQVGKCCKHLEFMHQKCQERLDEMIALQSLLESAEVYYNVQLKEVAVVVNAYGTYGKRVANTLSQLNDVIHKDDISPNYTTTTTANTTHKLEGEKSKGDHLDESYYSGNEYESCGGGGYSGGDDDDDDDVGDYNDTTGGDNDMDERQLSEPIEFNTDDNHQSSFSTSKKMSMNVFNSPVVVKSIHENQLNDSFNTMDSLMNRPIGIATVTTASQQTPPPPPTTTTSPFGFPIFQPICDASGDVDYRVLLNPALRNLTNNDTMNINNRSQEINQSLKSSSIDGINPDKTGHNINLTDLSSDNDNNNDKSLHKIRFPVKQQRQLSPNMKNTVYPNKVVLTTTMEPKPIENERLCKDGNHNEDEAGEDEDNMEVSDGEDPEVDNVDNDDDTKKKKTTMMKKANVDTIQQLITSDTQDKDWRIFTQQLPPEVRPLSHLSPSSSSSTAPSGNIPSPCIRRPPVPLPPPPPPPPAKDPIGWTLPLEPILQPIIPINQSNPLPSPSPICIPPPPPPPQFVGVGVGAGLGRGQQSFSPPPPPPPLPSTLNELTGYHHIPTAVLGGGGVVVAPPLPRPRPLPPPPPPPLLCPPPLVVQPPISPALHMDKINMISNDYNNNNNLLTKSIEPNVLIPPKVTTASSTAAAAPPPPLPTSTANSSATTQSQNYSAFDLLKNLCQSNVTMSGSGLSKPSSSSVSLPTFPLSSTIPASSSISKEYSRSIPCEQAINSTVSATGRPDGSGGGGDLLNPSKVSHTLMHETNSNPLVNSDDNNTTTTTTTTNNNNKSTEDPFAIISRLTGLSNLIKNIPIQSSLSAIPVTSPTLINSTESSRDNNNNNSEMSNCRLQSIPTTTTIIITEGLMNTSPAFITPPITTHTYTPCSAAKRSRFSDIPLSEGGIVDQRTIPLSVCTTEQLQPVLSSNSTVPYSFSSVSSSASFASSSSTSFPSTSLDINYSSNGKLSISNSFNNDLYDESIHERRDHSMTSNNNNNINNNSIGDDDVGDCDDGSDGSGGGDTPTQDEREDDHHHPISGIPQNRSLGSIHPFNTSTSSLADLLIPNDNNNNDNNSCHGVDPNSFLSKNPMHSISQSSCMLSSSTTSSSQGYGVSFTNNSNLMNTSTPPVSCIGLPFTQFSMIPPNVMPSIMTGSNTTNMSVTSCSQVPPGGITGGGLMCYQSPRIPLPSPPRGLPPGAFMLSPQHQHQQQQQIRPIMSSLLPGNIQQMPSSSTSSDWSKSVVINNQLRQQQQQQLQPPLVIQHSSNDFWSMMSTVPPPPPPSHSLSSSTRPPQGSLQLRQSSFPPTFNPSQIRSQTPSSIGIFNRFAIHKPR